MFSNKLNYRLINMTALLLLFYIGFSNIELWVQIIGKIISLLVPFLISFAFSYSLYPLVGFLTRRGMKKYLAVTVIILGFSLFAICLIIIIFPLLYEQLVLFSKYVISLFKHINSNFHWNLGKFELELTDYLNSMLHHLSNVIGNKAVYVVSKSVHFVSNLVIAYVSGIYFLYHMNIIRDRIKFITKKISTRFYQYIKRLDMELGNYVKGLVIIMLIQLCEYSFLFLLVGHPNWLLLGILAAVTTIIPYFGGLFTNVIGVAIATTVSIKVLIGTTIICILFPLIDNYFVSPKIYGKMNDVNPLVSIIVIAISGSLFGMFGIITSLPLYLLFRTTYSFFKSNLKDEVKKITTHI